MSESNPNVFKISVFWSAWTPKIATRILRDLLALQRVARSQRATLLVACDPQLAPQATAMGVSVTDNFLAPDLSRVYVEDPNTMSDDLHQRLLPDTEMVVLHGNADPLRPLVIEDDPYAGVKFYKDWHTIRETMPLNQKPPPSNGEPLMSPFL